MLQNPPDLVTSLTILKSNRKQEKSYKQFTYDHVVFIEKK